MLILAAVVAALLIIQLDLPAAQAFIRANRRQATVIGIGVYFLLGFTFIPASPLTLFLAVLLGPLHTVLIAVGWQYPGCFIGVPNRRCYGRCSQLCK